MMIFANHLWGLGPKVPREAIENLVLMISPFAPHVGEECWSMLGHQQSTAYHPWPKYEEALTIDDVVKIGVQVNGKTRGEVSVPAEAMQEEVLAAAQALEKVAAFVDGKKVVKVIFVPKKILNIVVK